MSENRFVLRLAESDLTAGEPLPWPLFDAGGRESRCRGDRFPVRAFRAGAPR
ncbi:hypothetical protein [Burkholderia gladioli]|uniref:hypothetical protein n=1 Tax=Burkholderia gladioli TaxID=28095 RepID=UPI00163FAAF7|nr:hypothetical protein [Burkholderia gladioli]MBU9199018.1 hypothetical protein [Burkholderia gladioli]MBU9216006.1 hypothetical protein [Burkholderia gladioli]MBU9424416.1 hypothetical protein [Burkholderia gladioli]MDN7725637.1 hypothetical protein [Burkholderia gladioli]MDN7739085.1 hypothetical protein [Burkholderia gladioli]